MQHTCKHICINTHRWYNIMVKNELAGTWFSRVNCCIESWGLWQSLSSFFSFTLIVLKWIFGGRSLELSGIVRRWEFWPTPLVRGSNYFECTQFLGLLFKQKHGPSVTCKGDKRRCVLQAKEDVLLHILRVEIFSVCVDHFAFCKIKKKKKSLQAFWVGCNIKQP